MLPQELAPTDWDPATTERSSRPASDEPGQAYEENPPVATPAPQDDHALASEPASSSAGEVGTNSVPPIAQGQAGTQITKWLPSETAMVALEEEELREQLPANDSLGG